MILLLILPFILTFIVINYLIYNRKDDGWGKEGLYCMGALGTFIIGTIVSASLFIILTTTEPGNCKTITEIGGCHQYYCGVKLSDGSFTQAKYPVVGQQVCQNIRRWR